MDITIRPEIQADYRIVENLTREAFWDVYHPGATEHLIIHKLRHIPGFVPKLDLVALLDGQIVGHIAYSKAKIINADNREHEVLCMAPLSVSPALQKKGIGGQLMEYSKTLAAGLGYKGIVIFGSPLYYSRYGFKNAEQFGITTSGGENFDAFMALELYPGGLTGIKGKFYEDPIFNITGQEVDEFEKDFPHKEKHITDTQLK